MQPIIEFESIEQAKKYLKEWQTRLFLDDWIIRLDLVDHDQIGDDRFAEIISVKVCKTAIIRLRRLDNAKSLPIERQQTEAFCMEKALVHELLHLKFSFTDAAQDTIEGNYMRECEHTLIEQIAKSLIMAKYNLGLSFFVNF